MTINQNWPPKKARWLYSEPTMTYRKAYNDYRKGFWKGAKGELTCLSTMHMNSQVSLNNHDENIQASSIFESAKDPKLITQFHKLEQYRLAYRRFRLGLPKGAEGDITKLIQKFSSDDIHLLPVAALARCLADQVRQKVAVGAPEPTFHVHFGAGKLGLGLVVPSIIKSHKYFAIMQRPSEAWNSILESNRLLIDIMINDKLISNLHVIRSDKDLIRLGFLSEETPTNEHPKLILPPNGDTQGHFGLLVLDKTLESLVVRAADSFSCSLGPAIKTSLTHLREYLPPNSGLHRPALYACENDHQAVNCIRSSLEDSLYIRECLVDRICSDRIIYEDKVEVKTEPYEGDLVVTATHQEAIKPAFAGPCVHLPRTSGAYSYLYNRKFLLVNGTHTTLAFMTLCKFCKDPHEAPGDYELLSADKLEDQELELRAWMAARCLVLLNNHELDVIKFAHNITKDEDVVNTLWSYATETMKRFSTVRDSTKRVLGGGVENRYNTRLKAIYDTICTFNNTLPLGDQLLKVSGFKSMKQLQDIVQKLVLKSEIFLHHNDTSNSSLFPSFFTAGFNQYVRSKNQ